MRFLITLYCRICVFYYLILCKCTSKLKNININKVKLKSIIIHRKTYKMIEQPISVTVTYPHL